jgi:hypothetical protein
MITLDLGFRQLRAVGVLSLVLGGWGAIATSSAWADDICKPAAPQPQSKCKKDAQCCPGLVCQAGNCRGGCRIGGTFRPSGALNGQCQSCQPTVSTTGWTNLPNGTTCTDGNLCTQADACQEGVCAGTPVPVDCQCHTAGSTCDPSTGLCSNPPQIDGDPCDDGVTCTKDDFCFAGRCLGGDMDCPTAICSVARCNVETDACELDPVVCRTPPPEPDGTQCFVNNCQTSSGVCLTSCAFAECSTGPTGFGPCKDAFNCSTNADCQDNNICTNDVCDLNTRLCSNGPITCPDGDRTTFDYCDPKVGCVHQQLNPQVLCDDHIACTLDGLDPVDNCIHTPLDDRCASTDPCEVGICDPGAGDPTTGCRFEAVPCDP